MIKIVNIYVSTRVPGVQGDGGQEMYLLVSTEEFLVTYCGEHFSEDLACEDGVFGVGYFADFFLFCFAGEAFCLCG